MKDILLKNKVIVVTGGAGLIGKHLVGAIIEEGGVAVSADVNNPDKFSVQDSTCISAKVDITSVESIRKLTSIILKKYGKIDALVNCAYPQTKNYGKKFESVSYHDFCENLSLHLGGYFLMCQQLLRIFKKQKQGNIINMASVYGFMNPRFELYRGIDMTMPVAYAAIKAGLIHLTKYMAKYYQGNNIRINCISPGGVHDKQNPVFVKRYKTQCSNKGLLDARDLRGTLIYLLSDMSRYVNGQNLVVDDGFSL